MFTMSLSVTFVTEQNKSYSNSNGNHRNLNKSDGDSRTEKDIGEIIHEWVYGYEYDANNGYNNRMTIVIERGNEYDTRDDDTIFMYDYSQSNHVKIDEESLMSMPKEELVKMLKTNEEIHRMQNNESQVIFECFGCEQKELMKFTFELSLNGIEVAINDELLDRSFSNFEEIEDTVSDPQKMERILTRLFKYTLPKSQQSELTVLCDIDPANIKTSAVTSPDPEGEEFDTKPFADMILMNQSKLETQLQEKENEIKEYKEQINILKQQLQMSQLMQVISKSDTTSTPSISNISIRSSAFNNDEETSSESSDDESVYSDEDTEEKYTYSM